VKGHSSLPNPENYQGIRQEVINVIEKDITYPSSNQNPQYRIKNNVIDII
jgi:hypothetical protein